MNVAIRDPSVFETLNPADVAAFLTASGWRQRDFRPGHSSIWNTTYEGQPVELLLPLNRHFKDYLVRMAEIVPLLAAVEKRPQLEVLADLQTAGADIIRVRYRYASAQDGSIPLAQGEALVENARELCLAGACAAVNKRAYYATLKPQQARDFVQKLRLGQSERGSYVVTVLSPVPPQLQAANESLFADEPEPPFERQAVIQVSRALTALRAAADEAMTSFQMAVFERAVRDGVSANLCSALVEMGGSILQPGDELAISFTWARSRPAESAVAREIVFPGDRLPVIAEAARRYRSSMAPEEIEIRGVIVQLKADQPDGPIAGPVVVRTTLDGRTRKVQIALDPASHRLAWQAYESRAEVTCRGELVVPATI